MSTFSKLHRNAPLILLAAAAGCVFPAHAQVGLGLNPMRLELAGRAGAQTSGVLTLMNDTAHTSRVVAEVLDFYIDETTTPQFLRGIAKEAEWSCRDWVVVNPMEVDLAGNAQALIRYTIHVPSGAPARSFHCAIGFTTEPAASALKVTGVRTAVQVVAAVYVVVGEPATEGSVKDIRLEWKAGGKTPGWMGVVVLHNPGQMHYRPTGELEVLNPAGEVVETAQFVPFPVLPGRDQRFVFPLQLQGGQGSYTLRARVDLGTSEIQEATARVQADRPATAKP